jgi:hypothetical protein
MRTRNASAAKKVDLFLVPYTVILDVLLSGCSLKSGVDVALSLGATRGRRKGERLTIRARLRRDGGDVTPGRRRRTGAARKVKREPTRASTEPADLYGRRAHHEPADNASSQAA